MPYLFDIACFEARKASSRFVAAIAAFVPVEAAFFVGFDCESKVLLKLVVVATPDMRLRSIEAIVEL